VGGVRVREEIAVAEQREPVATDAAAVARSGRQTQQFKI